MEATAGLVADSGLAEAAGSGSGLAEAAGLVADMGEPDWG